MLSCTMKRSVTVAGVTLPAEKKIFIALQAVYGIGPMTSKNICSQCSVSETKKPYELTEQEILAIRSEVEKISVGDELRSKIIMDVRRLQEIGCRRALRLQKGLPVRGQRTKTNSRTARKLRGLFSKGSVSTNANDNLKGKKGQQKGAKGTKGGKSSTAKKKK